MLSLTYYKKRADADFAREHHLFFRDEERAVIRVAAEANNTRGFELETTKRQQQGGASGKGGRVFRMWADSQEERDMWVESLLSTMAQGPLALCRGTRVDQKKTKQKLQK